jgi:hypothetical protein
MSDIQSQHRAQRRQHLFNATATLEFNVEARDSSVSVQQMHSVRKRHALAIAIDGLGPDTQCLPPWYPAAPSPPAEGRLGDDLPAGDGDVLAVEDREQRCQEDGRKEAQPDPVESVWRSSRTAEGGSRSWPVWPKPPAQKEDTTGDEPHPQTVPGLAHHQHDAVLALLDRIAFSATEDPDCLRDLGSEVRDLRSGPPSPSGALRIRLLQRFPWASTWACEVPKSGS